MDLNFLMVIVGLLGAISSFSFSFLAFKRTEKRDCKDEGKSEGIIFSDIGYIKACVERMEKNYINVDERYRNILERLAKVEENLINAQKNIDSIIEQGG